MGTPKTTQRGEEYLAFPVMETMLCVTQKPEANLVSIEATPHGAISVGPCYVPGLGGVLNLAIHARDGEIIAATLGPKQFPAFADMILRAATRLAAGEFEKPEIRQ